jgi:hypothetical protein
VHDYVTAQRRAQAFVAEGATAEIALDALPFLAACAIAGGPPSPSVPPVRTDREPLTKRFPALGDFIEVHWQGWAAGVAGGVVPGPTDIIIQALVTLRAQDLATAKSTYDFQPPPTNLVLKVNEELKPFLPAPADWRYNRRFEEDVKTAYYGGVVQLDVLSGTVFLHVSSM